MRKERRKFKGSSLSLQLSDDESDDNYYVPGDRRTGKYFDVSRCNEEPAVFADKPDLKVCTFF